MTKILLADDHKLVLTGVRSVLERNPALLVVAEAETGRQAVEMAASTGADLVLIDIGMPEMNGIEATLRMTEENPALKVIILSMHSGREYVAWALRSGATGFLLKSAAVAELATAINTVLRGEIFICGELLRCGITPESVRAENASGPLEGLPPRQREILQMLAEGINTKEIAGILDISVKTVETHRAHLMNRLGIHDLPGLVRFAIRTGLVSPEK